MANVFYIPTGIKNLAVMFPTVAWSSVEDYWIEVMDSATIIATTPLMSKGCCCSDDDVVVHFLNYLGTFDTINFAQPTVNHETKSTLFKKSLNASLSKTDYGWQRFNISANDTYEFKNTCLEDSDMIWVQELFDSPLAFIQWDGAQGQAASYIPITIMDGTLTKEKGDGGSFINVTTIKAQLSNTYFTIRN